MQCRTSFFINLDQKLITPYGFLFRPDEISEASLEDRTLLLDFETVPLASCPRTTLVLTNTSAIKASFSIELDHFKAAKPPTPPEGIYPAI